MRFGVIFPNEASFYHKMGAEIFENYPSVQKLYQKMSKTIDLKRTLIYEQTEHNWDDTSKALAVLLTSVSFYRVWKETYQLKPTVLIGSGVGALSALVCAGTLSVSSAVGMICKKSLKLPPFSQPDGSVFACGKRLNDAAAVQALKKSPNEVETILHCVEEERLDCVIEIGPNNLITKALREAAPNGAQFVSLDDPNDNAVILENFEYSKHFNYLYGARRMLAIAAATQNHNSDDENDEQIISAYLAVKAFVDEALKKQYSGHGLHIGAYDLKLCADQLKIILRCKETPNEEVQARIIALENEIALPLRAQFAQWF